VGGWLLSVMDLASIRLWHHLATYAVIAFFFVHIYVAWWLDTVEKNGIMGSIFGGYKFVTGKEWE
jgi:Ni,Fe-hydrogenase I cytochrome b subunit